RAHLAPGVAEEAERPRRRDCGILLAQRARRRVAWIDKNRVPRCGLSLVELEEAGLGHIDLAAHLADVRHVPALELLRHVRERADVGGHVLALAAVAA